MNIYNSGTIGKQDFYTQTRASGDIYALARGASEEFLVGFSRGEKLSIRIEPKEEEKIEVFFKTTLADGKVEFGSMTVKDGEGFATIEEIFKATIENLGYEKEIIGQEALAKKLLEAGVKISSYCSDLHIPANEVTREILKDYTYPNNISTFRDEVDGGFAFEIPFAYSKEYYEKPGEEKLQDIIRPLDYGDKPSVEKDMANEATVIASVAKL